MRTIFGLFVDPEGTRNAVLGLRRLGLDPDAIHVVTSEPYHEFEFTGDPDTSRTSRYALVGGIIGGISGAALAAGTAVWVDLPTGGMPIVAYPPVGIITFALAGLGAVAGTLLATFRAAPLPDFEGVLYDPVLYQNVAAGGFLLAVLCRRDDWVPQIRQLLLDAGANPVK